MVLGEYYSRILNVSLECLTLLTILTSKYKIHTFYLYCILKLKHFVSSNYFFTSLRILNGPISF